MPKPGDYDLTLDEGGKSGMQEAELEALNVDKEEDEELAALLDL